ncbi:S1-like domain-containing RNA-binding protein [Siphonobacter sp. SORGH_AS_0500]|uniref:CvfB family protein n=1 Tax=Siphonobacter sp. SORGH_AS_0500 TaxID=1864824 RepID=UPI002854BD3A|nr:S1-like domain-containing RNA-binding protein [Siphonobacter sp. SORGH_AS_0500]MDR6194988.1 putative RNA-binding protein (virulence factor B family) [Siphonobacter sp. SORGH_AS_0500]
MITVGKKNTLTALRLTSVGMFMGNGEDEILLPNKYIPENLGEGDALEVFIYRDSEDRLIATTLQPKLELYEFGLLTVKSVSKFGAFLDWGLEKDLLVPFSEQNHPLEEGESVVVGLVPDVETDRLIGTCKVGQYLEYDRIPFAPGNEVECLIYERSDLGYNAIIDNHYRGLFYYNEVFQPLTIGTKVKAFIKQVRVDKSIDLSLQPQGYYQSVDINTEKILKKLEEQNGFLALSDSSDPAMIYATLEMSKKAFKKAIGALYRERIIRLEEDGIYRN